jgi:lauroyl/myristoyl acyltransferase
MQTRGQIMRCWLRVGSLIAVLIVGSTAEGDQPSPTLEAQQPWQRQLQRDDAKQAQKLNQQIAQLVEKGEFQPAVKLSKELLA